ASGGVGTLTWSSVGAANSLPPGLTLSSAGALSGTPSKTGSYSFPITVQDQRQNTASGTFSVNVQSPPPVITNSSPLPDGTPTVTPTSPAPNGATGVPYSLALTATGGSPPYTWSVLSGALPDGLSLSFGGSITGTPTAVGQFTFTVRAIDSPPGTLAAQTATK